VVGTSQFEAAVLELRARGADEASLPPLMARAKEGRAEFEVKVVDASG
jgi:hypothetical protein